MISMNKVYDWWESLSEERQLEIMTSYYADAVKEDTDIDKMFGDMPNSYQIWIYRREVQINV